MTGENKILKVVTADDEQDIIIAGNKRYLNVTTTAYDILMAGLAKAQREMDSISYSKSKYKTYSEGINALFPAQQQRRPTYTPHEISRWKQVILTMDARPAPGIAEGLSLITGIKYEYKFINGTRRDEWQVLFYPQGTPENAIKQAEDDYKAENFVFRSAPRRTAVL